MSALANAKSALSQVRRAFEDIEAKSLAWRTSEGARLIEPKLVGLVVVAGLCVTFVHSYAPRTKAKLHEKWLGVLSEDAAQLAATVFGHEHWGMLARQTHWSLIALVGYVLVPLLYLRFVPPRERLRDYGLKLGGALAHWRLYVVVLLGLTPFLAWAVNQPRFYVYYPLYRHAGRSLTDFFAWEVLYLAQFFAVEVFYRGFLLFAFERRFGAYAILFPVLPYCMLHFSKPLPEVAGAIFAALILGSLALYTRSIWLGVAAHMTVALIMDVLALLQRGLLG